MDDPWGSPWAELPSKPNPTPPEPASSLLSPPPKAFFGATSPSASPWSNDADAFGDWAGASAEQHDPIPGSPNWGAWGEPSPTRLSPTIALDRSGRPSSGAWPGSTPTPPSSGLTPLPRSRTPSTHRQPVIDPWASELSQNLARVDDRVTPQAHNNGGMVPSESDKPQENYIIARNAVKSEDSESKGDAVPRQKGPPTNIQGSGSSPRSSLAISIDSSHEIERQDSPITPVDEVPKEPVTPGSQRSPGKVQQLVEKFDGLARSASEEPEHSSPRSPKQQRDGIPRMGSLNFSEALQSPLPPSEDEESLSNPLGSQSVTSTSSDRSDTPKEFTIQQSAEPDRGAITEAGMSSADHSVEVKEIIAKYGTLAFQPDIAALEQMEAKAAPPSIDAAELPDPRDGVIKDSFVEISERKTWYRISRFGSMRKHDLGDDENYTRITWPTTRLHDDTIVIVRRWMEEDSFAGKNRLGGIKRSSAFNWDSAAAPVDLSTIYARKTSIDSARNASANAARHGPKSAISSQTSAWGANNHSRESSQTEISLGQASIPSFGWNSTTPKPSVAFALPPPDQANVSRSGLTLQASRATKQSAHFQPLTLQKLGVASADDNDDDDEWGEMVASPGFAVHTPVQSGALFAAHDPEPLLTLSDTGLPAHSSAPLANIWGIDDISGLDSPSDPTAMNLGAAPASPSKFFVPSISLDQAVNIDEPSQLEGFASETISAASFPPSIPRDIESMRIATAIIDQLPDLSYMLH